MLRYEKGNKECMQFQEDTKMTNMGDRIKELLDKKKMNQKK